MTTSEARCCAVEGAGVTDEGGGVLMQSGEQRHWSDRRRWRRAQTKEAAIAAAKDQSKGELRLQQCREDARRRREGAGVTTADGTGGHDDHARRRWQVQPEGGGAAIEGGAGGGGERRGGSRSGEGPPAPEAPAGRPPAATASRSGRTRTTLLQ